MIAAKTFQGFPEIRKQFSSDHSLEEGGTEKYYFALVRGEAGDVKIIYIYIPMYIYIYRDISKSSKFWDSGKSTSLAVHTWFKYILIISKHFPLWSQWRSARCKCPQKRSKSPRTGWWGPWQMVEVAFRVLGFAERGPHGWWSIGGPKKWCPHGGFLSHFPEIHQLNGESREYVGWIHWFGTLQGSQCISTRGNGKLCRGMMGVRRMERKRLGIGKRISEAKRKKDLNQENRKAAWMQPPSMSPSRGSRTDPDRVMHTTPCYICRSSQVAHIKSGFIVLK